MLFLFAAVRPATIPIPVKDERFTVNFTITNLLYSSEFQNPSSSKYNATRNTLAHMVSPGESHPSISLQYVQYFEFVLFLLTSLSNPCWQLDLLLKNSSIGPTHTGCTVVALR